MRGAIRDPVLLTSILFKQEFGFEYMALGPNTACPMSWEWLFTFYIRWLKKTQKKNILWHGKIIWSQNLIVYNIFYWNIATPICLLIICGCFCSVQIEWFWQRPWGCKVENTHSLAIYRKSHLIPCLRRIWTWGLERIALGLEEFKVFYAVDAFGYWLLMLMNLSVSWNGQTGRLREEDRD